MKHIYERYKPFPDEVFNEFRMVPPSSILSPGPFTTEHDAPKVTEPQIALDRRADSLKTNSGNVLSPIQENAALMKLPNDYIPPKFDIQGMARKIHPEITIDEELDKALQSLGDYFIDECVKGAIKFSKHNQQAYLNDVDIRQYLTSTHLGLFTSTGLQDEPLKPPTRKPSTKSLNRAARISETVYPKQPVVLALNELNSN